METQRIVYNDKVVRQFLWASVLFGIVGMLVGIIIALQLAFWPANLPPFLSFGRLRPLHTNAVIFAFVGNMLFAGIYYSTQRLVKARLASDILSAIHFWGWQLIIVAAAVSLPLGFTTGKEYAELEWPIDISIALIWVVFAVNFFWTLGKRREKHLYVAIWFYIATDHHRRCSAHRQQLRDSGRRLQELLGLRGRPGRAGAVVVRPQRGRLLPDHADSRHHVLLPAEGGRAAGVLVPLVDRPLLGPGFPLHLGRSSPFALHRPARLGAEPRHGLQLDALGAELGRHAERPADPPRGLGQATRRSRPEVLRSRRDLLRHEHLRGPAPQHQERERPRALHGLDHRSRARRRPGLERPHGSRHVLLAGSQALRHEAPLPRSRELPLLDRDRRHPSLRHLDVGRGHHAGPDVARGQ